MRPMQLTLSAFGPFAGQEQIDFTRLGDNPLFLINGATGSGKTTILDAICFALYGQTTGAEREARQMRCDHADGKRLTEIELVFALAGKRYKLHRIPEQERPRQRASQDGSDTVLQKPQAALHRLNDNDDEKLLANKPTEVNAGIIRLTGLRVEQFRKVMVLPQGKFRDFLIADSKDKQKIFNDLFATHRYKQIEDKLHQQAREVRQARRELIDKQSGILESVEMASSEALQAAIDEHKPLTEKAKTTHQTAQTSLLTLNKSWQQMQELEQAFSRLEEQQQQQQDLQAQAKDIEALKQTLEKIQVAERLQPEFQQYQRSTKEQQQAERALQKAEQDFSARQQQQQASEEQVKTLPEQERQLEASQKQHTELQGFVQRHQQLNDARTALSRDEKQFTEQLKQQNRQQQLLKQHQDKQQQLEHQKAELEKNQANEAELKTRLATLQTQWKNCQQRDALAQALAQKQQRLDKMAQQGKVLKQQLDEAKQTHKQLELRWHQAQAAILARELQQDQPCPVCGSTEHPAPAHHGSDDIPSETQRQASQQHIEQLNAQYLKAREDYSALNKETEKDQEQLDALHKEVDADAETLQTQLRQTENELQTREKQQQQIQQLDKSLSDLQQTIEQATNTLEESKTRTSQCQSALEASKALVKKAEQELPESWREAGALDKALQEATSRIKQQQQHIQQIRNQQIAVSKQFEAAKTSLDNARQEAEKRQQQATKDTECWNKTLSDSPFDNQPDFENSLQQAPQAKHIRQQIDDYQQQCAHLKGAIEQQQAKIKDQQRPDLASLKAQLQQQQQMANAAEKAWQDANAQLQTLQGALDSIHKLAGQQQQQEAQYRVIGTLSDVANGQTGNKISLQRFVLGVLLEDVLSVATQHLLHMSKGRYQLLRKEQRAKGNKASGLELEVEDSHSGKRRPVETLSGGEGFIASLALALGLSEVVQNHAGGIQLDTLFIDEGFGSLDAEALDLAVRTLIDLREGGRMIGIISHVSELKEQINLRLDIENSQRGSHIQIIT